MFNTEMIYFYIQPEETTIKRFKKGRELLSIKEPNRIIVTRNKVRAWKGVAVGHNAVISEPLENDRFLCNPFRNRDLILEDWDIAVEFIRLLINKRVLNPFTTIIRPQVIMHLKIEPEKPLSMIETRTLQDIAVRAGAREAFVCKLNNMLTAEMLAESKPEPEEKIEARGPKSRIQ